MTGFIVYFTFEQYDEPGIRNCPAGNSPAVAITLDTISRGLDHLECLLFLGQVMEYFEQHMLDQFSC